MIDDISQIQATVSEIQATLASLTPPSARPAAAPGASSQSSAFSQALAAAQAAPAARTQSPATVSGINVPPASLGPLPALPVIPSASDLSPLPATASDADNISGIIQTAAAQNGVDPSLVRAIIQTESGGNPRAVSPAGAMGLMQLMPANVKDAGIADPFDPAQNIAAGTKQIAGFLKQYHGDLTLALAAYNAGPGNVQKYGGVPPFPETQNYVRKVQAAMGKG